MLEPEVVHWLQTNGEPFWRKTPSKFRLPATETLPAKVEVPVLETMRLLTVVVPAPSVPEKVLVPVPCTVRFCVVVAPPEIVSPVVCVPAPMVVEPVEPIEKKLAYAIEPVGERCIAKASVCPPSFRFHAE